MGPRSHFPGVSWGSVDPDISSVQPGGLAVPSLPVLWDLIWLPTCLGWIFSIWGLLLPLPLAWELHKTETLAVGPSCLVLCSSLPHQCLGANVD